MFGSLSGSGYPGTMKDYLDHPAVAAVYVGGSRASGLADEHSDTDVYVLTTGPVDLEWRRDLIESRSPLRMSLAPGHFGDGDAWTDADGVFDVMFWDLKETLSGLRRILIDHVTSSGYTTAFWHTIRGWHEAGRRIDHDEALGELSELATRPYPDALAQAIIDNNRVLLRGVMFSLEDQLITAARRGDMISINHRTAAIIASWADIVFAANRTPHPGEKRLGSHLAGLPSAPPDWTQDIIELVAADCESVAGICRGMLDRLEAWLDSGSIPPAQLRST